MRTNILKIIIVLSLCLIIIFLSSQCKDNTVNPESPIPHLFLAIDSLKFGSVYPSLKAQKPIILENIGYENISFSVSIEGTNQNDFSIIEKTQPIILKPGQKDTLLIQFSPKDAGHKSACLKMTRVNGKAFIELYGYCNMYGFGFEHINIDIQGPHLEKWNDTLNRILSYSVSNLPYYENVLVNWNNNDFSFYLKFVSNGRRYTISIKGRLSSTEKEIEYLDYYYTYDNFDVGRLIDHTEKSWSIINIPYYPNNFKVLYKTTGIGLKDHVKISSIYVKYIWINYTDQTAIETHDYISSEWNDSSYIQVEFY